LEIYLQLSQNELKNCLYAASTAAMRAGARILSYYGKELDLSTSKGFGYEKSDLVTQADKEAQEIIESILIDFHPEIGFLAEEDGQNENTSRFEKPYFWSVDPLDGTKPFVNHLNGFAVSIGLVAKDGRPLLGVCYFPVFGDLFYGTVGEAAFHNEHQLKMPANSGAIKLYLSEAESLPQKNNEFYHALSADLLGSGFSKIKAETIMAPVHKGCLLADGNEPALYYGLPRKKLGVSLWDFAAISAILHAAGAWVSDMYGNPLDLNRADSTFVHHHGFLVATSEKIAKTALATFEKYRTFYE
jgi:3'(2'), 5'-bisphosphate nucleotidase/myo-inositol-1(or 4)-monophosphatase